MTLPKDNMTDKDIHDTIDKKVDGFVAVMTTLITTENTTIRHSIDKLTEKVDIQNGSVRVLKEWKVKREAELAKEKEFADKRVVSSRDSWYRILTIIGLAVAIVIGVWNGRKNDRNMNLVEDTEQALRKEIRQTEGISKVTRNGYVKYNDNGLSDSVKVK